MSCLLFIYDAHVANINGGMRDCKGVYRTFDEASLALYSHGVPDNTLMLYADIFDTERNTNAHFRITPDGREQVSEESYIVRKPYGETPDIY